MNLPTSIALAVIGLAVAIWAVGGFITWDWNLANWSESGRISAVYFWALLTCLAVAVIVEYKR